MLRLGEIKSLLESVVVSEFDGISCDSINGKAWFDVRDEAIKAISDAERQAADDAFPIDEQFIYSIAEQFEAEANELNFPRIQLRGGEVSIEWCVSENGSIELRVAFEDQVGGIDAIEIDLPHIKTRGQLRRLIAALKGGEA